MARIVNDWHIKHFAPLFPPVYLSEISGITSLSTGKEILGWLIACPLTPAHFLELPEKQVYRKIIQTGRLAERLGAKILGLGAYTSVVGDAGITIAQALDIPVTTGDSYTVAIAVQAVREAANAMDIRLQHASAAVVGATGAIGRICAELLAGEVAELHLIGRHLDTLQQLRERLEEAHPGRRLTVSTDMSALRETEVILTVTSAMHSVVEPQHLRPGCVVCDVARPRDVSARVAALRDDVLVIDGGMVDVPGPVDFHFNFGFPPRKAYACMAETMALTLEGRFEDYTLGKQLSRSRVDEIQEIATRHGFRLSGFRSFERPVTAEQIEQIKQNARKRQRHSKTPGRLSYE